MGKLHPSLFLSREDFDLLLAKDRNRAVSIYANMREAARRDLACFVAFRFFNQGRALHWNWHLDYLCAIFTAVFRRELRRTIINIPPRFLKSELIGQCFPAWMIGRDDTPRSSVLSASATAGLAARDSRKTLEIIKSPWYQALFPNVKTLKETEVEWETKGGATRNAAGADGLITGRGGDHLIWDDVLLAKDAMSEVVREKTNEWLGETFRSRLNDQTTGTITGIMQRVHELDPTGFLVKQMERAGADQYEVIVLPNEAPTRTVVEFKGVIYAEREAGDLLHPARLGVTETAALKAALRDNYEGQYQQNPVKMAGGFFDIPRLQLLRQTGEDLRDSLGLFPNFYLDFASREKETQKDDPDFSAILVAARDRMQRLVILDLFLKQCSHDELARVLINLRRKWRPRYIKGEKGALLNVFQPVLRQQQHLTGEFFALQPLPNRDKDKVARASSLQGLWNAGLVCAPAGAPWLEDFLRQARSFPKGAHDDAVDPAADAAGDFEDLRIGDPSIARDTGGAEGGGCLVSSQERRAFNTVYLQELERVRDGMLNPPKHHLDW